MEAVAALPPVEAAPAPSVRLTPPAIDASGGGSSPAAHRIDLRERFADLGARAACGVLFALLSANIVRDFIATKHFTGLLLLASEALVVIFIVLRRRARIVDRTLAARVITGMSMLGPPLLRAGSETPLLPDAVTATVSVAGVLLVIAAKLTLGRSFGLVPANRGVVDSGPYRMMRHPIYTGYLISHVAFIAAHPTAMNIGLVVAGDAALILRALYEERTLVKDDKYRSYCGRVGWHFVPGIF